MKLFEIFFLSANVSGINWPGGKKLTWRELQEIIYRPDTTDLQARSQFKKSWGAPVGGKFLPHQDCQALPEFKDSTGYECDGASCAIKCRPGFQPIGEARTNCISSRKSKPIWTNTIRGCGSCVPPVFSDFNLRDFCFVEKDKNQRVCKVRCTDGADALKGLKKGELRCVCTKKLGCRWFSGKRKNKPLRLTKVQCKAREEMRILEEPLTCDQKPPGCFDIWNNIEIYRTWSCDTCYMIEADLVPPSSFDSSDYFELGLSTPIKEAIQWSFPVKSVNHTEINNENIVKIDFSNGDLASIEKTGFWKVKFQIEIKAEKKPKLEYAKGCFCSEEPQVDIDL